LFEICGVLARRSPTGGREREVTVSNLLTEMITKPSRNWGTGYANELSAKNEYSDPAWQEIIYKGRHCRQDAHFSPISLFPAYAIFTVLKSQEIVISNLHQCWKGNNILTNKLLNYLYINERSSCMKIAIFICFFISHS
jgi:hypothetical protein